MKKRFFVFIIAVIVTLSSFTAFAEKGGEDFSEIKNIKVDTKEILQNYITAESMMKNAGKAEDIFARMDAVPFADLVTYYQVKSIETSRDNTPENNKIETDIMSDIIDISKINDNIFRYMAKTKYRAALLEWAEMTDEELDEYINELPSDMEYTLQKEINDLTAEYNLMQDTPTNLETMEDYVAFFKKYSKKVSEVFIKLANKRNELAKLRGYDNYADYAYAEVYPKDFDKESEEKFYENIKKHIIPIYKDVVSIPYATATEDDSSAEEIISETKEYLNDMSPKLTEAIDYMVEHNLYDFDDTGNKLDIGYTLYLCKYKVPFLFINPAVYDIRTTLFHEYGHYYSFFFDPNLEEDEDTFLNGDCNLDIAEIQSQGLQTLFLHYYDKIYGANATSQKIQQVANLVSSITNCAIISKWERMVYEEKEPLTNKKLCELYQSSIDYFGMQDFAIADEDGAYGWSRIPHVFQSPMYYISYSLSAVPALELLSITDEEREKDVEKYLKLANSGSYVPFAETLEECGFNSVFEEQTFIDLTNTIRSYLGFNYEDVTNEDWCWPYVILANDFYMDTKTETNFYPNETSTRFDFVKAIGKIENNISEITETKSPFSDIDNSFISWAAENSVAAGISDTEFGGNLPLTREQAACFIYRYFGEPDYENEMDFKDCGDVSDWAEEAVSWAEENKIFSGYEDKTFKPQNLITRAEAATLIALISMQAE